MAANHTRCFAYALGATLAVAGATAFAQPQSASAPEKPMVVAQASGAPVARPAPAPTMDYPPLEAGVRRAAAQGPEALRRYVHRTRYIYAWYYPDFAR